MWSNSPVANPHAMTSRFIVFVSQARLHTSRAFTLISMLPSSTKGRLGLGLVLVLGVALALFSLGALPFPLPFSTSPSSAKDICSPCPTCSACSEACPQCRWCPACPECLSAAPCPVQRAGTFAPNHANDFTPYLHNLNNFRAQYLISSHHSLCTDGRVLSWNESKLSRV